MVLGFSVQVVGLALNPKTLLVFFFTSTILILLLIIGFRIQGALPEAYGLYSPQNRSQQIWKPWSLLFRVYDALGIRSCSFEVSGLGSRVSCSGIRWFSCLGLRV